MRSLALAIAVALMAALTIAGAVSAGDERPYKAKFTGSGIGVEQRCGPNALTIGFEISGVATHMGRLTGTGSNCTQFTALTEAVDIWDGIVILEAADGSTLTLSAEGNQGRPQGGVAEVIQTLLVVSGTGRFEDASGTLDLVGVVDFNDFSTSGTVSGWLSY